MTLLGIFSFCPNCSWWLLPLLLGAWLLGYLLWNWTKGSSYRSEVNGLHGDIKNWKKKFNETELELSQAKYEREKMGGEFATLKSRFADQDTKYQALESKYKTVSANVGSSTIDTSEWTNRIAALEAELKASQDANLELQNKEGSSDGDASKWLTQIADLQSQLEISRNNNLQLQSDEGSSDEDNSKWTQQISDLESQLEVSRNTNLKLQGDYATLKNRFNEMQAELETEVPTQGSEVMSDKDERVKALEEELETAKSKYETLVVQLNERETPDMSTGAVLGTGAALGIMGSAADEGKVEELEKELEAARASNLALKANQNILQADLDTLIAQSKEVQSEKKDTTDFEARIQDLEKKLALSYENNAKMEGDYANLKAGYGDLEMKLQEPAPDNSEEIVGLQNRIGELELLLASKPAADDSEPGEGKKKKKKKKSKKKKNKKKNKKKKKGKKDEGEKMEESSSGKKSIYAVTFGTDNLQIVEGIGPKIEGVLKASGINTWAELAQSSEARLLEILEAAGPRYKMHNPNTWPNQAKMADRDEWKKLVDFQKVLGGDADKPSDSKVEKLYAKARGFKIYDLNDLKVVEGIGPKIEGLLKDADIDTWKKLAKAKVSDLQAVLDLAGARYKLANPSTWGKQAKMAADGEWETLKNYQDTLKGGKE